MLLDQLPLYRSIQALYVQKSAEWRERRAQLFVDLVQPPKGARVLDLGGSEGEFMSKIRERTDVRVTIADIRPGALEQARFHGFETALLQEGRPLPFDDGAFDVVFCNSVIEHVTMPKDLCDSPRVGNREWTQTSLQNQRAFAREIRRLAASHFVQTPHRAFPLEAHTWLPFVGWMSHRTTVRLVKVTDRVWVRRCGIVDWNLLGEREMREMFPLSKIHVERVFGLPKSLIAYSPMRQ